MEVRISETLKKIIFKETESIIGQTEEFSKDLGTTTKWKAKVFSRGLMAEDTKETTKMTRKKETGPSFGLMADNTKVDGKMANNTVWVHTPQLQANPNKESGKTERDFTGSLTMVLNNEINNMHA